MAYEFLLYMLSRAFTHIVPTTNQKLVYTLSNRSMKVWKSELGSWGFSVLKRHNPLQPPWLLASSGVLTSS